MEIPIKCLECGKITRKFEIGRAAYYMGNESSEIITKDKIVCPKCKKDISNKKCVTKKGEFMISILAITMGMMAQKDQDLKLPSHLQGMFLLNKNNFFQLRNKSNGVIKLVQKF